MYRIVKAYDLITSPAFIVLSRRERIKRRTLQRRKRKNLYLSHHAAIRPEVSLRDGVLSNLV